MQKRQEDKTESPKLEAEVDLGTGVDRRSHRAKHASEKRRCHFIVIHRTSCIMTAGIFMNANLDLERNQESEVVVRCIYHGQLIDDQMDILSSNIKMAKVNTVRRVM